MLFCSRQTQALPKLPEEKSEFSFSFGFGFACTCKHPLTLRLPGGCRCMVLPRLSCMIECWWKLYGDSEVRSAAESETCDGRSSVKSRFHVNNYSQWTRCGIGGRPPAPWTFHYAWTNIYRTTKTDAPAPEGGRAAKQKAPRERGHKRCGVGKIIGRTCGLAGRSDQLFMETLAAAAAAATERRRPLLAAAKFVRSLVRRYWLFGMPPQCRLKRRREVTSHYLWSLVVAKLPAIGLLLLLLYTCDAAGAAAARNHGMMEVSRWYPLRPAATLSSGGYIGYSAETIYMYAYSTST